MKVNIDTRPLWGTAGGDGIKGGYINPANAGVPRVEIMLNWLYTPCTFGAHMWAHWLHNS